MRVLTQNNTRNVVATITADTSRTKSQATNSDKGIVRRTTKDHTLNTEFCTWSENVRNKSQWWCITDMATWTYNELLQAGEKEKGFNVPLVLPRPTESILPIVGCTKASVGVREIWALGNTSCTTALVITRMVAGWRENISLGAVVSREVKCRGCQRSGAGDREMSSGRNWSDHTFVRRDSWQERSKISWLVHYALWMERKKKVVRVTDYC